MVNMFDYNYLYYTLISTNIQDSFMQILSIVLLVLKFSFASLGLL